MTTINTNGQGSLTVLKESPRNTEGKTVYVKTEPNGASLSDWEMFDFIETMLKESGVRYDYTGARGLIIQRPCSPAYFARRDELASKFWLRSYEECEASNQAAIDYIIDGELERGELR